MQFHQSNQSVPTSPLDLAHDALIFYLCVVGKEESLAKNNGKRAIALKRQEHLTAGLDRTALSVRHDAKILVVWLHQNVAASQFPH